MADTGSPGEETGRLDGPVLPDSDDRVSPPAEVGQGLVEYGLALFLMAIMILVILQLVGPRIGSIFSRLTQIG